MSSTSPMKLRQFLHTRYLPRHINCGLRAAEQLAISISLFERWMQREAHTRDLSEQAVLDWLRWLRDSGRAPSTVNSKRQQLLAIWREARRQKMAGPLPEDGIPKVREPKRNPPAWTLEQITRLLTTSRSLPGVIAGTEIAACDWWTSLLLVIYDTGARISAVLAVDWSDIDLDQRRITFRAESAKTDLEQVLQLSNQTVRALSRLPNRRSAVWPLDCRRETIWERFGRLLELADLPNDRHSKFHRIRRTTATLATLHGSIELAQEQLGHTDAQMTRRAYIDQTQIPRRSAVDVLPRPAIDRAG